MRRKRSYLYKNRFLGQTIGLVNLNLDKVLNPSVTDCPRCKIMIIKLTSESYYGGLMI